jgi:putative protein kinase ArgK-like GTPase of G3E family
MRYKIKATDTAQYEQAKKLLDERNIKTTSASRLILGVDGVSKSTLRALESLGCQVSQETRYDLELDMVGS